MNLCNLTPAQREAIETDKQRWSLANKMVNNQSPEQIKRWLAAQSGEYGADMDRRLRVCWRAKVK